jgi:hypothetical protein
MAARTLFFPNIAIFLCAFILSLLVAISLPSLPTLDIVRCHFTGDTVPHVSTDPVSIKEIRVHPFLMRPRRPAPPPPPPPWKKMANASADDNKVVVNPRAPSVRSPHIHRTTWEEYLRGPRRKGSRRVPGCSSLCISTNLHIPCVTQELLLYSTFIPVWADFCAIAK